MNPNSRDIKNKMSRVKVISRNQNKINLRDFGTQRNVDIDYDEFVRFIESLYPEDIEIGDSGEIIWTDDKLPEFIKDICQMSKAIFSLKKEIKGFTVRVFKPPTKTDHKKITTIARVPQEQAMTVGARIIIPLGTCEDFSIFVSTGQSVSQSGSGSLRLSDKWGLMTPIGLAAGADFTFNDGIEGKIEARTGFRTMSFRKNPLKRYVLVIDCINDMEVLLKAVKDEAKVAAKGDETKAAEFEEKLREALDLPASTPAEEVGKMASN
jgi:hypothetical protein